MSESGAGAAAIDWTVLEALRDLGVSGEPGIIGELARLFVADTPPRLAALREAAERGEPDGLALAAHGLKGSCAIIGATRMQQVCLELEQLGRSGTLDGAADRIATLDVEFERARRALAREADSRDAGG